jgi:hypothetical protein
MIFIPGWAISLATFPGVIIHEAGHFLFCRIFKVAIFDACFFRVGNPAGYVVHEATQDFTTSFFISMGPFFTNTVLCVVFCSAAFLPVFELKISDPLGWFFFWLGLSIGMHAIPSNQDMKNLWQLAPQAAKRGNVLAIVSYPIVGAVRVLNLLRVVWADLGYGLAVGILGPLAVFKVLA